MLMRTEVKSPCFHCGEPVPPHSHLSVEIEGVERPMCCPGCQAVASLIAGSGLESFYRLRTRLNEKAPELPKENLFKVYDDPANCRDFVEALDGGRYVARLLLGGVSCAACTWLIESALGRVDGVERASVNLSQQSLTVEWNPDKLPLSGIFQHLLALGYDPHPWQVSAGAELLKSEQRRALRELAVAGLAMMQVGMFAIALHAGDIQGIALEYRSLMRWVSLIIATVVVFYSARGFFHNAWTNLRHRRLVMDLPVALAIGLAYLASAWATLTNSGEVYFDSIAMFTFFLLLARFLERRVRQREFLRQTDLQSLLPVAALRRRGDGWETIPTRSACAGDRLLVRAGEVIPADGVIESGVGSVDEAAFSGEHLLRTVRPGDRVAAGTVLREGNAELKVTADAAGSRLNSMLSLMSRAVQEKPAIAQLADRVAAYFVAAVLLIAAGVAGWWLHKDPQQALWITLSVLVVSCPCALALATPAALTAATARLRRAGLLLVGENSLESLNNCTRVIFDKTGTLTRGELVRRRTMALPGVDAHQALALAAALEQQVKHPFSQAFADIQPASGVDNVQVVPGQGVRGRQGDRAIAIGSPAFAAAFCGAAVAPPPHPGHWIALVDESGPQAWFEVDDQPRAEAADVVRALQARGLEVELLTGDSSDAGVTLAAELDIGIVHSGVPPDEKLARIRQLQASGEIVTMVGDGLNDAPVLAAADCSFAVNEATDLAKSRADGILVNPTLTPLLLAFNVARRSRRVVRQNMAWAIGYNGLAVPLAAGGMIPPWLAAIGMSLSSLLVVLNSLRLK